LDGRVSAWENAPPPQWEAPPWQSPSGQPAPWQPSPWQPQSAGRPVLVGRVDALAGVATAAILVLLGAPVGLIWGHLAPSAAPGIVDFSSGLVFPFTDRLFSAQVVFFFLTLGVGVACGVGTAVFMRHSDRGVVGVAAGLAGGGLLATVVAAQVGQRVRAGSLGHVLSRLLARGGIHVADYVGLHFEPAYVAWAFGAVFGFVLLVGWGATAPK
jgi:hypothetical protein